jgi:hypothetical protein
MGIDGRVTDEEEEGTDYCCWLKGSWEAHKVQEETKKEEYGTGRRGLIRNMQGGQAMPERGRGSDEVCKLAYTVVKRLIRFNNKITVL